MEGIEKTVSALWQDYLFLTKEMGKFLDKQDLDLFLELVSQRERLQTMIEKRQSQAYQDTPPDQSLLSEIAQTNQLVLNKLKYMMNMEDKQHNISRAYDRYANNSIGGHMDWKS